MTRSTIFHRRYAAPGAAPGQATADADSHAPSIRAFLYDAQTLEEFALQNAAEARALVTPGKLLWVDVHGLGDGTIVRELGEQFELHELAVSDVINLGQRPKIDPYPGFLYAVVRMVRVDEASGFGWEQVSMFLGENWVLTIQERPGDCLDTLRARLRGGRPRLRGAGPDYLFTMILDALVDAYFPVLEHFAEELEELEEKILGRPDRKLLGRVYTVKRDLVAMRRAAWPLRDALTSLMRDEEDILSETVHPFLRDAVDHSIQVADVCETLRELSTSLVDVYLSTVGQRTNEVMRVLTVVSAIFIPLTFLAGIYGMNFDTAQPGNLPELGLPYGYLIFWAVGLGIAGTLLVVFRRLGWLGGASGS